MRTSRNSKVRVGITMGDPAGIGPAVIAKALGALAGRARFVVIGDSWVLTAGRIRAAGCLRFCDPRGSDRGEAVKIIDLGNVDRKRYSPGEVRAEYGKASLEYLDSAMGLLRGGKIDCLVTAPISKEAIAKAGCPFTGHTEYFEHYTRSKECVMMLMNEFLKFSLVTRHIALERVPRSLTVGSILGVINRTRRYLSGYFGIRSPRLAVCGLNPHASDNGHIGTEEKRIIAPALARARSAREARCDGPLPADTAVSRALAGRYDALIAMYHDQALIPLKMTGPGVNVTLGLPFIRTSPLHGTAFDIAAEPRKADPDSMIAAITTAIRCASNRKNV